MSEPLTVRAACRQRAALDGADAQALEHALTQTERERDDLRAKLEKAEADCNHLRAIIVYHGNAQVQALQNSSAHIQQVEAVYDGGYRLEVLDLATGTWSEPEETEGHVDTHERIALAAASIPRAGWLEYRIVQS